LLEVGAGEWNSIPARVKIREVQVSCWPIKKLCAEEECTLRHYQAY
jgi:hypothetical protein